MGLSYFLKSDEEFLNLEHYDWAALEEATKSGTYGDYVFAGTNSRKNFMYYNSDWYYIDAGLSSKLYKVKLDNPTGSYVTLEGDAYHYGEIDDVVYYAGEEAIYSYDLANGTNVKVVDVANEYPGYILCEFITRYDSLRAVLYNSTSEAFKEISIPVTSANVDVTGVSLNKTSLSFVEAGATATLTATVTPDNATNKNVTWKSSDTSVATVSGSGVVTAVANGTTTITVKTADGSKTATCEVTVEIPAPPVEPEPPVTDPVEEFVERMYTVALGRPSDEGGKANWVYMLKANTHDGAGIAAEFILGAEFALRGLSDEEYIDVLYQTFFNRAADQGGKDLWLAVLAAGNTRGYVLSNFVNLPEFTMLCAEYGIERGVMLESGQAVNPGIPQFVKRMYTIVLGRDAENEGLYNNVMALVAGALNAEQVAKNFFTSAEYLAKNKNTESYVRDLYAVFMNREADADGLSLWVSFIDQYGMSRDEVLSQFAASAEFKAIAASYGLE